MIFLTYEQVVEMHDALIQKFGGLIGLRDRGLLESALAKPLMAVFSEELHPSIYDKAAAYLLGISRNHPFIDGNKRTAAAVCLTFLRVNGKFPEYDTDDFAEYVAEVAQGKFSISEISVFLKKLCLSKVVK